MQKRTQPPRAHLPLRPSAFAVLAALAEAPRPGIDIMDAVNSTVTGGALLGPGTLYRLMRELRQDGLIDRLPRGQVEDERQAFHALTADGRAVLRAECDRLRRTLALASLARRGGRA